MVLHESLFDVLAAYGFPATNVGRPCVVLTYYVDDSGSAKKPVEKHCVLAGYLADAGDWKDISQDWQAVLDTKPAIHHFKMGDAFHCGGVFKGWYPSDVHGKVIQLASVIKKHSAKLHEFSSFITWEHYDRYVTKKHLLSTPLFFCIHGVVSQICRHLEGTGEVVHLIADLGMAKQAEMGEQMDLLRHLNPIVGSLIFGLDYQNDELQPALQMADLIAWHVRRYHGDEYIEKQFDFLRKECLVQSTSIPWRPTAIKDLDNAVYPA